MDVGPRGRREGMGEYLPQIIPSVLVSEGVESADAGCGEDEWAA